MKQHLRPLVALTAPLALAACVVGTPPPAGVTTAPLSPTPAASGPTTAATPTAVASASALPPGIFFRDDFDGTALDPARWTTFEREGRVSVAGGKLEMLVGGQAAGFPIVVPVEDNIPQQGPYYVEVHYEIGSAGRLSGFKLDYVPPMSADDLGLTEPFMLWGVYQSGMTFQFRNERTTIAALPGEGSLKVGEPHRFRMEFDGTSTYRVIYDQAELITFQSRRRPSRLWFGPNQTKAASTAAVWSTLLVDSVESGLLVTPDPAAPRATPTPPPATPGPSPSASEGGPTSPAPSEEPSASPSEEPSASPSA